MVTLASHALFAWPQQAAVARPGLPMVLDLRGLYEQLWCQHLAVPARAGETLRDQLDQLSLLSAKQAAAAKLETRLALTKQFNRKVVLNAELRDHRNIIMELTQSFSSP